jgi:hypothetical protein
VKGKGPGKGPAKGTGGKGLLKGKVAPAYVEPPGPLLAPPGTQQLALRNVLTSVEGTLWQGLDPWGMGGTDLLEGTSIDYEEIQKLWLPVPPRPAPTVAVVRSVLPGSIASNAGIIVKAHKLTPEVVREGLTKDADKLSPAQALALADGLAPLADEAATHLQMAVNARGVASLNEHETVLWTIQNIPLGWERVRLVAERHVVQEEGASARESAASATCLAESLRDSRSLRTMLQMILTARNILGQKGYAGYSVKSFETISSERAPRHAAIDPATGRPLLVSHDWMQTNTPSVLRLTAKMLEKTHVYRCRLRFLRKLSVSRLVPINSVRQITWSYLDDLQESSWDVLHLLAKCKGNVCDADMHHSLNYRVDRLVVLRSRELEQVNRSSQHDTASLQQNIVPYNRFAQQMAELEVNVDDAILTIAQAMRELDEAAVSISRLAGLPVRQNIDDQFRDASVGALRNLFALGENLRQEMKAVQQANQRERLATQAKGVGASAVLHRSWEIVDTSHILHATGDPDLVREFRGVGEEATGNSDQQAQPHGGSQPNAKAKAKAQATSKTKKGAAAYVDLVHSGLEGQYRYDHTTRSWGRRLDGVDGTGGAELNLGDRSWLNFS